MTEKEIDKQKLLEQIRDIRKAKKDGKLVIFVGAGVSKNSYLPDWEDLIKAIAQKLDYNNCSNCIFDEKSCRKCGKSLKDDCDNCKYKYKFSQDDYLKVPQYLYNKYGKRSKHKYYNVIKEFFDKPVKSNHIHNTILEIFPHHIITTNYDHLLEEVNHINTNSYQVIKNDNDLLKTYRPKYIIKMHGDLSDIKNIVLKEQDYIEYSHKHTLIETFIKSLLIDHTFLFVGYSLNDNNIKLILGWINFIAKQSKKEERAKNYLITAIDNNKYFINEYGNLKYTTLGAGPKVQLAFDPLTAEYNRKNDKKLDNKVQMVNLTTSTDVPNKIPNLFKCQQYFMDNSTPDYILFPNAKDEYNSNSYAKGLLNAAGINDLGGPEMFEVLVLGSNPYVTNTAIPGYEYPVPKKYFGLS